MVLDVVIIPRASTHLVAILDAILPLTIVLDLLMTGAIEITLQEGMVTEILAILTRRLAEVVEITLQGAMTTEILAVLTRQFTEVALSRGRHPFIDRIIPHPVIPDPVILVADVQ